MGKDCRLCGQAAETASHVLTQCRSKPVCAIRAKYLPKTPKLNTILYGKATEMRQTCKFFGDFLEMAEAIQQAAQNC